MLKYYKVKPGDTLTKIANQYGVSINDITGYRSGNKDLIYPGEVLTINTAGVNLVSDSLLNNNVRSSFENTYQGMTTLDYDMPIVSYTKQLESEMENTNKEYKSVLDEIKKLNDEIDNISIEEPKELKDVERKIKESLSRINYLEKQREKIPILIQMQAEGRAIEENEADKISFSALRKNTLALLEEQAKYELYKGNYEIASDLFAERLRLEVEPKIRKLETLKNQLKVIVDNYKNAKDKYGKAVLELAKNKLKEKDQELRKTKMYLDNSIKQAKLELERKKLDSRKQKAQRSYKKTQDDDLLYNEFVSNEDGLLW